MAATATAPAPVETPASTPAEPDDVLHYSNASDERIGRWLAGEPLALFTLCGIVLPRDSRLILDPTARVECAPCVEAGRRLP